MIMMIVVIGIRTGPPAGNAGGSDDGLCGSGVYNYKYTDVYDIYYLFMLIVYIYIYIYIHYVYMHIYICVYIYIYMYVYRIRRGTLI